MPVFLKKREHFQSIHRDSCGNTIEEKIPFINNDTEFYFYIRGHIRDSFNTDRLKNFVKLLKSNFKNIKFILQTWKHKEFKKNESWRCIKEDNTIISREIIENYFKDKDITERCLIIDERSIELVGKTHGRVEGSLAPTLGWKNMWYGIYKGLEHLDDNSSNIIVSFRYDYFNIHQSKGINDEQIIKFISDNLNSVYIRFIKYNCEGTDNLYMGRCNKIKTLIKRFHYNLDDILDTNKFSIVRQNNQELLVNIVANSI